MSLASPIIQLATSSPNDALLQVGDLRGKLCFETEQVTAVVSLKEAKELAAKFFELKIPRCSVYVAVIRYWLCHQEPSGEIVTPFDRWLRFPWPYLNPNEGRALRELLLDDRIVDRDHFWRCVEDFKSKPPYMNAYGIQTRLAQEGRSTPECWNAMIKQRRADGWVYGPEPAGVAKEAPWIVDFDKLDPDMQNDLFAKDARIDSYGIKLRSKEAVEQEWANSWTPEP